MKVMQHDRGGGKTTAAVNWVLESQDTRAIVVMAVSQRDTLLVNHRSLRRENVVVVDPRRPNTMSELLLERGSLREYVVDDADVLLSRLISTRIKAITVMGDEQ